jgi:hypothetical protein
VVCVLVMDRLAGDVIEFQTLERHTMDVESVVEMALNAWDAMEFSGLLIDMTYVVYVVETTEHAKVVMDLEVEPLMSVVFAVEMDLLAEAVMEWDLLLTIVECVVETTQPANASSIMDITLKKWIIFSYSGQSTEPSKTLTMPYIQCQNPWNISTTMKEMLIWAALSFTLMPSWNPVKILWPSKLKLCQMKLM